MVSTSQAGVFHGRTPATDVHRPAAGPHVHLYRKNFLLFVGIATVGPAANAIFQILTVGADVGAPFGSRRAATGAATLATTGLGVIVGYVIMLAGMALSHAATVKAVAAVYLGRETSVIGAYKALRGRIWSLFGTFA